MPPTFELSKGATRMLLLMILAIFLFVLFLPRSVAREKIGPLHVTTTYDDKWIFSQSKIFGEIERETLRENEIFVSDASVEANTALRQ